MIVTRVFSFVFYVLSPLLKNRRDEMGGKVQRLMTCFIVLLMHPFFSSAYKKKVKQWKGWSLCNTLYPGKYSISYVQSQTKPNSYFCPYSRGHTSQWRKYQLHWILFPSGGPARLDPAPGRWVWAAWMSAVTKPESWRGCKNVWRRRNHRRGIWALSNYGNCCSRGWTWW